MLPNCGKDAEHAYPDCHAPGGLMRLCCEHDAALDAARKELKRTDPKAVLRALVAKLPKCDDCDQPAVFEFDKDLGRYVSGLCQKHGECHPYFEEHPDRVVSWAAELREAMKLLSGS